MGRQLFAEPLCRLAGNLQKAAGIIILDERARVLQQPHRPPLQHEQAPLLRLGAGQGLIHSAPAPTLPWKRSGRGRRHRNTNRRRATPASRRNTRSMNYENQLCRV